MWQRGWLLVLAVLCCSSTLLAAPRVRVEVRGDCPSREAVERQLAPFTVLSSDDEPHFRVVVRAQAGGASLELYRPDGGRALERSIHSDDCASLAEAFALIVRAHFLELGLELPEANGVPSSQPHQLPSKDALAPPAGRDASSDEGESEPVEPQAGAEAAGEEGPSDEAGEGIEAGEGEAGSPAGAWQPAFGVGLGARALVPSRRFSPALHLELEGLYRVLAVRAELSADLGSKSDEPHPVWRQSSELLVSTGLHLGQRTWLDLRAGLGAALAWARATELPSSSPTASLTPVGLLGLRGGYGSRTWSVWLDLGTTALFKRDRYVVDPFGSVGLGPRWYAQSLLGARIDW